MQRGAERTYVHRHRSRREAGRRGYCAVGADVLERLAARTTSRASSPAPTGRGGAGPLGAPPAKETADRLGISVRNPSG